MLFLINLLGSSNVTHTNFFNYVKGNWKGIILKTYPSYSDPFVKRISADLLADTSYLAINLQSYDNEFNSDHFLKVTDESDTKLILANKFNDDIGWVVTNESNRNMFMLNGYTTDKEELIHAVVSFRHIVINIYNNKLGNETHINLNSQNIIDNASHIIKMFLLVVTFGIVIYGLWKTSDLADVIKPDEALYAKVIKAKSILEAERKKVAEELEKERERIREEREQKKLLNNNTDEKPKVELIDDEPTE